MIDFKTSGLADVCWLIVAALAVVCGQAGAVVSPDTLDGKVICGYQGWFMAPGDGNPASVGWRHWSRETEAIGPGLYTVEMWPDVREYAAGDLFTASGVTLQDGSTGKLFSSFRPGAVDLHFQWMEDYGIDGVFLQRFVSELGDPRFFAIRNQVLANVRASAAVHGRVFALEYDTSGTAPANMFEAITSDWEYLVDTAGLLGDPRYLHHAGKPVVILWGLGFAERGHTPAMAQQIIDYFKNDPEYGGNLVIGGVPTYWRTLEGDSETDAGWADVYRSFDIINPWMVGRVGSKEDIDHFVENVWGPDLAETGGAGIGYMPVVFPGFSWDNLQQLPPGSSLFPRRGGAFLWEQVYAWQDLGVDMMFVAMFDEVDEGTAVFKVSANYPVTDHWVDYEGYPTDWYLRLVSEASRMLRGEIPLTESIPIDSDGDSIPDVTDTDDDGDGISDADEVNGTNGYVTDPWSADTDGDGFDDNVEPDYGSDPSDGEMFPAAVVWVDFLYMGTERGTQSNPMNTLGEGVQLVLPGGVVNLGAGASPSPITISKPVRLEAPEGSARIG